MLSFSTQMNRTWRQTLSIATAFWGACLVLVGIDATLGWNWVARGLFLLSIPMLVVCLTWVNKGLVFDQAQRSFAAVLALGAAVLGASTVIILVGLLAASSLESMMTGRL